MLISSKNAKQIFERHLATALIAISNCSDGVSEYKLLVMIVF